MQNSKKAHGLWFIFQMPTAASRGPRPKPGSRDPTQAWRAHSGSALLSSVTRVSRTWRGARGNHRTVRLRYEVWTSQPLELWLAESDLTLRLSSLASGSNLIMKYSLKSLLPLPNFLSLVLCWWDHYNPLHNFLLCFRRICIWAFLPC